MFELPLNGYGRWTHKHKESVIMKNIMTNGKRDGGLESNVFEFREKLGKRHELLGMTQENGMHGPVARRAGSAAPSRRARKQMESNEQSAEVTKLR